MPLLDLPSKSVVNRIVPKNAFDNYTNTKQKKQMVDLIERIRWANKLSLETINLGGKEVNEIQVFDIELRKKDGVADLLRVIDKAIPYTIIFRLDYRGQILISTSKKHIHPSNENGGVIDWTFTTDWFEKEHDNYNLNLERSLDHVYLNFCKKISGRCNIAKSISDLIGFETQFNLLNNAINKLKLNISTSKQFNRKVELNTQLALKTEELSKLLSKV